MDQDQAPTAPEPQNSDGVSVSDGKIINKPEKAERYPEGSKITRRPISRRLGSTQNKKIIHISAKTPFMSVVRRVIKRLEHPGNPNSTTRGLPLAARIAALGVAGSNTTGSSNSTPAGAGQDEGRGHEVVMVGAGRAIEKTVNLAAWFQRQGPYAIALRTKTVGVIDDVEVEGEEIWQSHVRRISCLEVGIRLK